MNKYFIQLFMKENTVILPGFGALTAPNGNLEDIMFVPYLTVDDGKLADFIAETEGVDSQDAQNTIAKFIREMEANLSKGESFDIFQFGSFFKNESGEIEFSSWMKSGEEKAIQVDEEETNTIAIKKEVEELVDEAIEDTKNEVQEAEVTESKITPSETEPIVDIEEISEAHKEEAISFEPDAISEATEEVKIDVSALNIEDEAITFESSKDENSGLFVTATQITENNKKRRFGIGFWILNVLILCLLAGSIYAYFNYDQLKKQLPFLAKNEKKVKVLTSDTLVNTKKDSIPVNKGSVTENSEKKTTQIEEPNIVQAAPNKSVISNEAKGYFLIGGVFGSETQAQKKVDQLLKEDIQAKVFPQKKGSVYVSLGEFSDKNGANAKLKELREKGLKVWVLNQ